MKKIFYASSLLVIFFLLGTTKASTQITPVNISVYNEGNGCSGDTFYFNQDQYVPDVDEWNWFINGDMLSVDSLFKIPLVSGNYRIELWGLNNSSPVLQGVFENLEVGGSPGKFFPENLAEFCPGENIQFNINAQYISYVYWDFGDGTFSYDTYTQHTYSSNDTFTVNLEIQFSNGCPSDMISQTIIVRENAIPTFEIQAPHEACIDDLIRFNINGNPSTVFWDFGDMQSSANYSPIHSYNTTDTFMVILEGHSMCGGTNFDTAYITIRDDLNANPSFNYWTNNGTSSCPGQTVKFYPQGPGVEYNWDFGDGGGSTLIEPAYRYPESGLFPATLTVKNGCGDVKTSYEVFVDIYKNGGYVTPQIEFGNNNDYMIDYDTIFICPGENVNFRFPIENYMGTDFDGYLYKWYFTGPESSDTIFTRDASFNISAPGMYEINLDMKSPCNWEYDSTMNKKYVRVGNVPIQANPNFAPREVCDGEYVYFWNEGSSLFERGYTVDILYDDVAPETGINTYSDPENEIIRSHVYNATNGYLVEMRIMNTCGDTVRYIDSVYADNDMAREPEYMVDNSTTEWEDTGEPEDWSVYDPLAHHFSIPVNVDFQTVTNNTYYLFMFYGGLSNSDGPPDGYVFRQLTPGAYHNDTADVYVPVPSFTDSIGIIAAWYCDTSDVGNDPNYTSEIWSDYYGAFVKSFPINTSDSTDIAVEYWGFADLNMTSCDNIKRMNGTWRSDSGGTYTFLDIWQEGEFNQRYNINTSKHPYQYENFVSSGNFGYISNIEFGDDNSGGPCSSMYGYYNYDLRPGGDTLIFSEMSESCDARRNAINNMIFTRFEENMQYAACPGDSVSLMVVGASSATWYFGDGQSEVVSIGPNISTKHVYNNHGVYNAFAVLSNNCSRSGDTVFTKVIVDSMNYPAGSIRMPFMEFTGTPVEFDFEENKRIDNNTYLWRFGDGSISSFKNPAYSYPKPGNYKVELDVTSHCGMKTFVDNIQIEDACDLISRFIIEPVNDSVFTFKQNIHGDYISFTWDIDGFIDNSQQDSIENYELTMGSVANIGLMVYSETPGCTDTLYKRIYVGQLATPQSCDIYFIYSPTAMQNQISFEAFVNSGNVMNFNWNYGDGYFDYGMSQPIHIFPAPGQYWVCVEGLDELGNPCGSFCDWVDVGGQSQNCFASFMAYPDELSVQFENLSTGDYTNVLWDYGNGVFSTDSNPSHIYVYPEAGNYQVCLMIENPLTGCYDQQCYYILVNDGSLECYADFEVEVDTNTLIAHFYSTSLNAQYYYWNTGDGIGYSEDSTFDYPYNFPGVYEVSLYIEDGTGCWGSISKPVQVGNMGAGQCFADFTYYTLPGTNTVEFYNTSFHGSEIVSGFYDFGDGTYSYDEENPTHTFPEAGLYIVCGNITTADGCQSGNCKEVFVGDMPCYTYFDYIPDPSTGSVRFIPDSTGADEYYWDFDDGTGDNIMEPVHHYIEPGYYIVCLSTYDIETNCWSDMCREIEVQTEGQTICNVNFSMSIDSITRTLHVSGNSATPFTEWYWDFGDGGFEIAKDTSHTYSADGVYPVCIFAYDNVSSCYAEKCKVVIMNSTTAGAQLTADFSAVPIPGTQKVKFKNKSLGNVDERYWTFGDGYYNDLKDTITHTYPYMGLWNTCLLVFNNTTFNSNQKCKQVFVGDATQCSLNADFSKIILPDSLKVTFKDKTTGGAFKWFWNFGDGATSAKRNPVHYYIDPGYYLVTMSVQDTTGLCIDHMASFIQVGTANCRSNFDFVVNSATNTVKFNNKSTGTIDDYYWYFDDGTFSTDTSPSHTFNPGMYNVSLTASSNSGCADFNFKEVQVGQIPCDAGFTVYVDESNNAFFNNNVLGGTNQLLWVFGDGKTSEANDPMHKYNYPGIYIVGLYAYTGSCMDYYEETIIVGQRGDDMQASFIHTVDENTRTVQFFNKSVGVDQNTSYIWDFGDSTFAFTANTNKTYSEGGYYFVCLTIIGDAGMQNTTCKMIRVAPPDNKNCLSDFFFTVDSATLTGTFTSRSIGVGTSDSYEWRLGYGVTNESGPNITHTFDSAGYYHVGLKIKNTTTHCTSVEYKMVNIGKELKGLKAGFEFEQDTSNLKSGGYPVDMVGVSSPPRPAKFSWDFGDMKKGSGYSTTSRVRHIYAETGSYIVCYTVEDPNTGESDEYCQIVNVTGSTLTNNSLFNLLTLDNSPNPFNDFTRINYTLPKEAYIELVVMDNLGREITTLIRNSKSAGSYDYLWDTSELPGGVYILRLSSSDGMAKIKMVIKK
ncbi:MAG: PKD domain-containing protein [Bacteroidales bacterium]|nr:PKD domain-containing protein [Bacteroidales bacterium]